MRKFLAIAPVIAAVFIATPAAAQATRTWVSGVGDDANPCSRTAPCKTLQGTISKTAAGGEINLLDPGGFGAVTITKSITIRSDGVEAGVLVSNTNGIIINAGTSDRIVLDGLDIEGLGNAGQNSLSGVRILSAGQVFVRNSAIRGFNTAGVSVDTGAVKITVTIDKVRFINDNVGVQVISSGGRATTRITDSLFTGNADTSIRVSGAGNRALLNNNHLLDPMNGLSLVSGGTATSSGNNTISSPTSDIPTIVPQG